MHDDDGLCSYIEFKLRHSLMFEGMFQLVEFLNSMQVHILFHGDWDLGLHCHNHRFHCS